MSEKRFKIFEQPSVSVDKCLVIVEYEDNVLSVEDVVELLNVQSDRIMLLEDNLLAMNMVNGELEGALKYLEEKNEKLYQQNRKLYKCALYGKTVGDEL